MNWKEFTMKYGGGLTKYQKKGEFNWKTYKDVGIQPLPSKSQIAAAQGQQRENTYVKPVVKNAAQLQRINQIQEEERQRRIQETADRVRGTLRATTDADIEAQNREDYTLTGRARSLGRGDFNPLVVAASAADLINPASYWYAGKDFGRGVKQTGEGIVNLDPEQIGSGLLQTGLSALQLYPGASTARSVIKGAAPRLFGSTMSSQADDFLRSVRSMDDFATGSPSVYRTQPGLSSGPISSTPAISRVGSTSGQAFIPSAKQTGKYSPSIVSDLSSFFAPFNPKNLQTNSGLEWMKQWYSDPDIIRRTEGNFPKGFSKFSIIMDSDNIGSKALKHFKNKLNAYEPKNYIDLLKDRGLKKYLQASMGSKGLSAGYPSGIYVNRTAAFPFDKRGLESTRVHELTHLIEHNGAIFNDDNIKSLLKPFGYSSLSEVPENKTLSFIDREIRGINPEYYLEPSEIHARMNQGRFNFNLTPKDQFTTKMFDEISKKYDWYGMGRYIKDKDAFIDLMNNFWAIPATVGIGAGAYQQFNQKPKGTYQTGGEESTEDTPKVISPLTISASESQWMKDKKKFGTDEIKWYESWNPKKWGLNDYTQYSSYNSAFRNARENKEDEFVYKGKRYNTKLIPKEDSNLYWESKNFLKDYYKNQPYAKVDDYDYEFNSNTDPYFKNKYGATWLELFDQQKNIPMDDPEWWEVDKKMTDIRNEEKAIRERKNQEYNKFYFDLKGGSSVSKKIENLDKPSYFSITSQKPKSMSEDGYWDPKNNKTFMFTNTEPGKLNTTYIHELSHKGDDAVEVYGTVPPINLKDFNLSPYRNDFSQEKFNYVSDPSEIEARKLSTLFYLYKNKQPWKAGKITEKGLDKLYDDYYEDKLPYDIGQLLMLYGSQRDDLLKYLNGDYNYNYKPEQKKEGGEQLPKYQTGGPTIDLKLPQFEQDKPRPFFEMSGAGTGPQYDMFGYGYLPLGKNLGISADLMGFKEGDWRVGRYGISGNINIPINRGERRTRPDIKDLPIYQKRGELTFNDSLRHQAGKILSYEQLRGGPGGIPLPQYGDPKYLNMLMNDVYPEVKKIMPNATAMEAGEAMDFIFNAGWDKENKKILKDPRAYALQEYYRQYDKSKLDKEGNWPGRKQPVTNELYSSTIGKLPENQRRILMNRGRDWYYKNTNNPAPGVPNPNYDATWYGRIWNTNDFLPFNPNNPRFTPTKQYGGASRADTLNLLANTMAVRNYYRGRNYAPDMNYTGRNLVSPYTGSVYKDTWDALKGDRSDFIHNNTKFGIITPSGQRRISMSDYYRPIDPNRFYQRESANFILDTRAPMQLFDRRIEPTGILGYTNINPSDPLSDDVISFYTYDPLSVTPWDMLSTKQKKQRINKYGVSGTPYESKQDFIEKTSDKEVIRKQKLLKESGLYKGEIDGDWGTGSEKAWKKYMELNTIPTTTNTSNTISETQVIPSTPRFNIQGIIADQYVPDAKDQTSREYRYRINTDKGFDIIKSKKDFEEWKQRNAAEYQPYYQKSTNAPIDYNKGRIQEYLETPTLTYTGDGTRRSGGESSYQYGGGFLPTRYTSDPYDPAIQNFLDSFTLNTLSNTGLRRLRNADYYMDFILNNKLDKQAVGSYTRLAKFNNKNPEPERVETRYLPFSMYEPIYNPVSVKVYKRPVQPVEYADPKIVEKQKLLKDAGLYTGELDGVWGSGSKKAWEEYTKRNTTPRSLDGMTEVTYPTSTMIETTKLDPNGNPVTEIHYYDDLRTRERKDPKVQKYLVQTYNQMSTPYKKAAVAKYGDPSKVPFQGVNIYELNPNPYMKEEGGETNLFNWNNLDQWFKNGGESDFVNNIYSDYMDGIYDGTPLEQNAKKVYDKLNTIYYRQAKESGMTPPNYIMTNVIKKALNPS